MLKYLLLALTISVVCNEGFKYEGLKRSDNSVEPLEQLIYQLVSMLQSASEQGKESLGKVINSDDVRTILKQLDSYSREYALAIIEGFKDTLKSEVELTKRGMKESSAQLINKLVNLLKDAMTQGREAFDKVLNDEDVQAILDHLGPLSRKVANSIIQGFKDLLDKIDNATKEQSISYKRDLKETSASLMNKLVVLLKKAFDQGLETYKKVINDEDVQAILKHLGPLSRRVAESLIRGFQSILEKIDNATNDQQEGYKRGIKDTSAQLINKLVNLLKDAFEQGREAFDKVVNDKDVQGILEHLGPLSRKFVQAIINSFYDLLDKIDLATKG